jgi:branched-chain amino acid transport system permease protein
MTINVTDIAVHNRRFKVQRSTRLSRITIPVLVIALIALASLPWWAGRDTLRDYTQIGAYLVVAMMWNLLAGYGGMVSIGQQAYFGIGGYAMLLLANYCGVSPFVAVPLGGAIAVLVAIPVSRLAFRLEGGYFAIGTWVIAEVFRLTVANMSWLGGGSGTSLIALQGVPRSLRASLTFWMALAIVTTMIALLYVFLRSKPGIALSAMRDDAVAAHSQGVNIKRVRLLVYLVSAGGTALAGGLYFVANLRISPDAAFSVNWTAYAIFMVMVGGLGTLEGPIVGTVIFFFLNKFLSDSGTWYLIGLGALAIFITLFFPTGIWGCASRRFGLHVFHTGRHVVYVKDPKK